MDEEMMSESTGTGTPRRAFAMTHMTDDDYVTTYWPQLREAIDRLLQGPPIATEHKGPVIQFEPMYSAAYKCVCQQHSETLYNDLISHINNYFLMIAMDLKNVDDAALIETYYTLIHRILYSLDGIIPIFTYLNRVYVVGKLGSNLRTELQKVFCAAVIDPVIDRLIEVIKLTPEFRPFQIAPHVLASIVKNLHKLNPNFATKYPEVFERYIPGVRPPMREHELPGYINETHELQLGLRQSWITTSTQGRKRHVDEEMLT